MGEYFYLNNYPNSFIYFYLTRILCVEFLLSYWYYYLSERSGVLLMPIGFPVALKNITLQQQSLTQSVINADDIVGDAFSIAAAVEIKQQH